MAGTMRALITQGDGTVEIQEVPIPQSGPGEILVKVHRVAQNPIDWKTATKAQEAGRTVGCDFAGSVADANGSSLARGLRVVGWVHGCDADPPRGAFAEYLVTEPSLVFPVPDSVADSQAAVVSLAVATALQALFQRLELPPPTTTSSAAGSGISLLINGGAGSVGQYAVQLAKLAGLFVIATGSEKNHELLKSLGADAVVDYRDADWVRQVKEAAKDDLRYAFDCISSLGTIGAVAQTISPRGGHVMCFLPAVADKIDAPANVKVESTIAYTVFGQALGGKHGPYVNADGDRSGDRRFWEKYLRLLPKWLEDGVLKPNAQRELGGLESIPDGFDLQQKGALSAEKLVYKIV